MVICISLQSKAEDESRQLRNQLQSMTEQLNQSETVQRDFVRLSQSLQVGRLTTLFFQLFCAVVANSTPGSSFCFSTESHLVYCRHGFYHCSCNLLLLYTFTSYFSYHTVQYHFNLIVMYIMTRILGGEQKHLSQYFFTVLAK